VDTLLGIFLWLDTREAGEFSYGLIARSPAKEALSWLFNAPNLMAAFSGRTVSIALLFLLSFCLAATAGEMTSSC